MSNRTMGVVVFCTATKPGTCKWCSCTWEDPCPGGCGWVDSTRRLCSWCAPIDQAWRDEPTRQLGASSLRRRQAFFRGFLAGNNDERAIDSGRQGRRSPFARGTDAYPFWRAGLAAGRSHF